MCSRRGRKRSNEELEAKESPKTRRRTPGFTPFKQVEIPASWKFELAKLREAVRASVAHCHYDDQSKRERLGNAVFEALTGQKTMKAAAITHGVPFTTLQTYFHRSRARMAKMMSDSDDAPPEQIQITVPLNLSAKNTIANALSEQQLTAKKTGKKDRLDSLLGALAVKVQETKSPESVSTVSAANLTSEHSGSNKRKPKNVRRIAPTTPEKGENEIIEEESGPPDCFSNQFQDLFLALQNGSGNKCVVSSELVNKYGSEEITAAISHVIPDISLNESTKQSVKTIITGVLHKTLNVDDVCAALKMEPAVLQSCVDRVEQYLSESKIDHENKMSVKSGFIEHENSVEDLLLLPGKAEYMDKIDECVNDVCSVSHYPAPQKEALRKAVAMVVRGECSVSGAAGIMQLPTSTVHPYVHRARAALADLFPRHSRNFNNNKKHTKADGVDESSSNESMSPTRLYKIPVSKQLEKVVADLVKISSYDGIGKQKLHDALFEVLTKDISVAQVSAKHGISTSIVQPYVTKARVLLGQSPYPTTSGLQDAKVTSSGTKFGNDTGGAVKNLINLFMNTSATPQAEDASASAYPEIPFENLESATVSANLVQQPVKSSSILNIESEVDDDDDDDDDDHQRDDSGDNDEFEGLPRSIRGVTKLLSDTKLDKISMKDYPGPESLAKKVSKVLRQYRFRGDRTKMRDAILEVLYKSKTLNEACRGSALAPTTLSTYVRLVKAIINTERAVSSESSATCPLLKMKLVKNENIIHDDDSGDNQQEIKSDSLNSRKYSTGSAPEIAAESTQNQNGQNPNNLTTEADFRAFNSANYEHQTNEDVKANIAVLSSVDVKFESHQNNGTMPIQNWSPFEKHHPSSAVLSVQSLDESMDIDMEQSLQKVNVMILHTASVMNDAERFYKLLIAYLIEQQYRRSEEAQEKMRASLEYVLLDGLSVAEALQIHKGPTEHVLMVYLNRCREVNKCIRKGFELLKQNIAHLLSKNSNPMSPVSVREKNATVSKMNAVTRYNRKRAAKEDDTETVTNAVSEKSSLKLLSTIFSEELRHTLYEYLKKLMDVNFPIEDNLIIGLAKMIVDEFPEEHKFTFTDSIWNQWLAGYRKTYPELEE